MSPKSVLINQFNYTTSVKTKHIEHKACALSNIDFIITTKRILNNTVEDTARPNI